MNVVHKRRRMERRRMAARGGHGKLTFFLIALIGMATLGALGIAGAVGAVFMVYQNYADEYVPINERLAQTHIGLTQIYDRNGLPLGQLTNPDAQLLNPVPLDEISKYLIDATVSTEDNNFWDNPGVNFRGLFRAGVEYLREGAGQSTGGSSITQQLIKNVYICPSIGEQGQAACTTGAERTIDRKLREITYALELNKDLPKERIIELYLNQISYADRYVGAEAAAEGYFHKHASELTLGEAALMAGIPQAPTDYHPRLNCEKDAEQQCVTDAEGRTKVLGAAKKRQEDVLDLMVVHKRATEAEVAAAKAEEVRVYATSNPIKAAAFIDDQVEPRLVRMCEAKILPQIKGTTDCTESVHSAAYNVTTTLDSTETAVAEQMIRGAVEDGLKKGCECNNAAIITIEPSTGQVIIYAPNRDPSYISDKRVKGDVDQLTEINQPGSSFKPAVYLTWFDRLNKAPQSILWDTSPLPVEGTEIINPRAGEPKTEGLITARAALGGSQNVGAFRAAQEAGPDNVIEMSKKLGITTLGQRFDPTWRSHPDVVYGASIATGGANIRAIDMAYMNSVLANMGVMVGVPNLVPKEKYFDPKNLHSLALDTGAGYEAAQREAHEFARGNIRLQGTRELDPVVILQVTDRDGNIIFTQGQPERRQVVNAGSAWLLYTIQSDCTARFIIWGCGSSNNDNNLDFYSDGVKVPSGIKTGTQQGPKSADDTLETWMTGYSRYAATAVWVGNADNTLVRDGARYGYAAANATIWLWKNWMGEYHSYLKRKGLVSTFAGFAELQPKNVAQVSFDSPATAGKLPGGCDQRLSGWRRTDVSYESECEEKEIDSRNGMLASDQTPAAFKTTGKFVKLPGYKPDAAVELAKKMGIPIAPTEKSAGQSALAISNVTNGKVVNATTPVVGSVNTAGLKKWTLQIGEGASPATWKDLGTGTAAVNEGTLGTIDIATTPDGVYTLRLTAEDPIIKGLSVTVTFNVRRGPATPGPGTPSASPGAGLTPQLPVPNFTPPARTITPPPTPTPQLPRNNNPNGPIR